MEIIKFYFRPKRVFQFASSTSDSDSYNSFTKWARWSIGKPNWVKRLVNSFNQSNDSYVHWIVGCVVIWKIHKVYKWFKLINCNPYRSESVIQFVECTTVLLSCLALKIRVKLFLRFSSRGFYIYGEPKGCYLKKN